MARSSLGVWFVGGGRGDGKLAQTLAALLLVILLLCLVLLGVSGLKAVPNVVGMTRPEAAKAIEKAGFKLGSETPKSSKTAEPGTVVEQSPRGGDRALPGSAISLFVASGGTTTTEGGESEEGPSGQGEGIPLPEWNGNPPREQTIVPYDSAATPSGVRVPSVMGMSRSAALSALASAGFSGAVRTGKSTTDVSPGTVFAQKPSAESYVPAGSTVVIYLSEGAPVGGFPYDKGPYTN